VDDIELGASVRFEGHAWTVAERNMSTATRYGQEAQEPYVTLVAQGGRRLVVRQSRWHLLKALPLTGRGQTG
jgi:hypothetical protein